MQKITRINDKLTVPSNPAIPYIEGDGIVKEITYSVWKIIDHAVEKAYGNQRGVVWKEMPQPPARRARTKPIPIGAALGVCNGRTWPR